MRLINKKVIGIAVAAAGVLAAAFLLLWPVYKEKKTNYMMRQTAIISDQTTMTADLSDEIGNGATEDDQGDFGNANVDFEALQQINPDIVAWIEVDGTSISYPILQSSPDEPEDYYLTHDAEKNESKHGAIYMQKRNDPKFKDFMTVLYGHNMRDGSMFRQLHNFKDNTFLQTHGRIVIHLPNGRKKYYKIISAEITTAENILITYDNFEDEDIAEAYWKNNIGTFDIGHCIVLSTCCGDPTKRLIVAAIEK